MKYRIDIKLVGYETVEVEAENEGEAGEKATTKFWGIYSHTPAARLRYKTTEATTLSEDV